MIFGGRRGRIEPQEIKVTLPSNTTINNLAKVFETETFSDCSIKFKQSGNSIPAHKLILMLNSDFFKACFENGMRETIEAAVEVDDDEKLMKVVIKSFYTGEITVDKKIDLVQLLKLADKYAVYSMELNLIDFIAKNIDSETMCQCIVHLEPDNDKYKALFDKLKQIPHLKTEILEKKVLLSLDFESLFKLFKMTVDKNNGFLAFKKAAEWVEKDKENRAVYSYELIQLINKQSY
jgi:hypothetical protein